MKFPTYKFIGDAILHSYSSIFFSQTRTLGLILLFLSFFNYVAGFYGLLSVVLVNLFSYLLQLNRLKIQTGYYGFNAVLTGIAVGSIFSFCPFSLFMLFASSMLIVYLSVFIEGIFNKYKLPYVSIPFLLALWCIQLSANCTDDFLGYGITSIQENTIWRYSCITYEINQLLDQIPSVLKAYFLSISSIFFQRSIFFGCLVSIGLLHYSRIGFTVSMLNHIVAFYMFQFINGTMYNMPYELLGFNFIFTSLAIGCYYIVPSIKSVVWSLLLIPLQYLLIFSSSRFLDYFYLPTYSLAFCSTTLLFIYFIRQQKSGLNPEIAKFLEASPEKTKYNTSVNDIRLSFINYYPVGLPFLGIWKVSQGHNGALTHKDNWKHAWDFIIEDKDGKQFTNEGQNLEDYFCYGKPIVAPANAVVVNVENDVNDNLPGADNKVQNWGNYVVLKLEDNLYVAICHLQQGSVSVAVNQTVMKGQRIASCGNSGHSPYPHIHMQLQQNAAIGSTTIEYPLSDILEVENGTNRFQKSYIPQANSLICNTNPSKDLFFAYNLSSYKRLIVSDEDHTEVWNLKIDLYGLNYIDDGKGNYAWFSTNKSNFYFYRYEGEKDSNLYMFHLSNYNVQLSTDYPWVINDKISLSAAGRGFALFLQDILAPINIFYTIDYNIKYELGGYKNPNAFVFSSEVKSSIFKKEKLLYSFKTTILEEKIEFVELTTPTGSSKTIRIKGERYE